MKTKSRPAPKIPERFRVSSATLYFDRFMTGLIMVGGVSIIVAVFFIFVFIAFKIAPLFRPAEVAAAQTFSIPDKGILSFGVDDSRQMLYVLTEGGNIYFLSLDEDHSGEEGAVFTVDAGLSDEFEVYSFYHDLQRDRFVLTSTDGRVQVKEVRFRPDFSGASERPVIRPSINLLPEVRLGVEDRPAFGAVYSAGDRQRLVAALHETGDGRTTVRAAILTQRHTPFGPGPVQVAAHADLIDVLTGEPKQILATGTGDGIVVAYTDGRISFFSVNVTGAVEHVQTFNPFADRNGARFAHMDFILGDQTIIFFDETGVHVAWNLAFIAEEARRLFIPSKTFDDLPGPLQSFAPSRRNKTFLVTSGNFARLSLMTTMATRWQANLDFNIRQAIIAPRYDALIFLDERNRLHVKEMVDDHPIAGFTAFFARIQYEGRPGRIWDWQSDGGADFERKLSMVPLMIGTLKGTVYAMFIAVPIALLSAVYVSQFLRPSLKRVVKPTMEIMASLPSVILGFFAGMWLSPIISNAVPSVMLAVVGIFVGALITGFVWTRLPNHVRLRVPTGWEFAIVLGPALFVAFLGWQFGQIVENWLFVQYDESLGRDVGSFRMWVVQVLGWDFETRNALVVGFAMGFAVIPIIFTISEDSMSNVPNAFRSGSLALGASRWQTAMRIVLPTAAAGIFSALMIGFGRAIGETMIMVMATGNAVVQDFNPFTGMRTLSANIAVEISEAEQNGTLYRTLFLCAFILFVFTFTLNTFAELLRQWLRKRYRAVE
jgi:phosphate transport system permease protein